MKRRFKPSVRAICSLGTLAHNRSFTARELREYSYSHPGSKGIRLHETMRWLQKHGHIRHAERGTGKWYPTAKGWKMIDAACRAKDKP